MEKVMNYAIYTEAKRYLYKNKTEGEIKEILKAFPAWTMLSTFIPDLEKEDDGKFVQRINRDGVITQKR
jgi:hypothetical protein